MAKKELIYLIGQPGSGKSTVAMELFRGIPGVQMDKPIAHVNYMSQQSIQLGAIRGSFSGTDAYPMNIQPKVVPFITDSDCTSFFGEGDRLANGKFFNECAMARVILTIFLLNTPHVEAAARRAERGSNQNHTWLKGRITKVLRLWADWGNPGFMLDGMKRPEEIVADMMGHRQVERLVRG